MRQKERVDVSSSNHILIVENARFHGLTAVQKKTQLDREGVSLHNNSISLETRGLINIVSSAILFPVTVICHLDERGRQKS